MVPVMVLAMVPVMVLALVLVMVMVLVLAMVFPLAAAFDGALGGLERCISRETFPLRWCR